MSQFFHEPAHPRQLLFRMANKGWLPRQTIVDTFHANPTDHQAFWHAIAAALQGAHPDFKPPWLGGGWRPPGLGTLPGLTTPPPRRIPFEGGSGPFVPPG